MRINRRNFIGTVTTRRGWRRFSPRYLYAEEMETENVTCLFTFEEVPYGWTVRYSVRPGNAFGVKGAAIATPFAVNKK